MTDAELTASAGCPAAVHDECAARARQVPIDRWESRTTAAMLSGGAVLDLEDLHEARRFVVLRRRLAQADVATARRWDDPDRWVITGPLEELERTVWAFPSLPGCVPGGPDWLIGSPRVATIEEAPRAKLVLELYHRQIDLREATSMALRTPATAAGMAVELLRTGLAPSEALAVAVRAATLSSQTLSDEKSTN